jgi:hypothetical protein
MSDSPFYVWKKNKSRLDLRLYTRMFEKNFKVTNKNIKVSEVGKIYAAYYKSENKITDKHHVTPLFISFGRFKDGAITRVRGLNLFYLSVSDIIDITQKVYNLSSNKPDDLAIEMIKIHKECIKKYPYAFKNFKESNITVINIIDSSEWGMIPLLYKYLYGNFNISALSRDYEKENIIIEPREKKSKQEKITPDQIATESIEWSEGEISEIDDI